MIKYEYDVLYLYEYHQRISYEYEYHVLFVYKKQKEGLSPILNQPTNQPTKRSSPNGRSSCPIRGSRIVRGKWWIMNLVGGFFSNPSEKYAHQNGFIFPKVRDENKRCLSCHHLGMMFKFELWNEEWKWKPPKKNTPEVSDSINCEN